MVARRCPRDVQFSSLLGHAISLSTSALHWARAETSQQHDVLELPPPTAPQMGVATRDRCQSSMSGTNYQFAEFDYASNDSNADPADHGNDSAFLWRHDRLRPRAWAERAVRNLDRRMIGCRKWDWCRRRSRGRHWHRGRIRRLGPLRQMDIGLGLPPGGVMADCLASLAITTADLRR
jgi:hypothetical protein